MNKIINKLLLVIMVIIVILLCTYFVLTIDTIVNSCSFYDNGVFLYCDI